MENYEAIVQDMGTDELIKALRECLPTKISYGDHIGAEPARAVSSLPVYPSKECYLMEEAAIRLELFADGAAEEVRRSEDLQARAAYERELLEKELALLRDERDWLRRQIDALTGSC